MRLDSSSSSSNAAAVTVASPASESLWGVGGLLQSRERSSPSPLSLQRQLDRDEGRHRRESRSQERNNQQRKLHYGRDARSPAQSPVTSPSPLPSPSPATFNLAAPAPMAFSVGYALTPKKARSFIQPKLEQHARLKGISLVAVDCSIPLTDQGPFDVLLHKFTGKEWRQSLEDYQRKYPDVVVLDPPEAILQLRNRQSMLQDVAELDLSSSGGFVGVPRQLVVTGDAMSIPASVSSAGLKLPLVAKPLVSDGSAKAHEMSLAYDKSCLNQLDPPLMLQEFVNHGGVLFKTYVVGDYVRVVRRFSLPDVHEGETFSNGVMPFPRVSCASRSAENADLDPQAAALPPRQLLESLSKELRRRLGLQLFNMDIIREGGAGNRYYVIDINYFPGFGKMPDYEEVFTDFLSDLAFEKSLKTRVESSDR